MAKSKARRDEHILELVRKCIDGRCPQFFKELFFYFLFFFYKDICARLTCQSNLLHPPVVKTELASR